MILKPVLAKAAAIVLPPVDAAATPAAAPTPDYVVAIYLGLLTAIPFALAAVAMIFFARHSDRHNERKYHIAARAC